MDFRFEIGVFDETKVPEKVRFHAFTRTRTDKSILSRRRFLTGQKVVTGLPDDV